ncbi:methyl-accepting chemotaxis protein [Aliidiomarina quisquiliarum]|uniref:methyl-accepting chemotaxis protein n=1 Tax=Aliidiomarina quisquiliarum TaxID=2938947 RepID=UPI00208FC499|nr:methyl-accepting chemotaxis protein [Aliidiomarina quisquiliarum]MCO4321930.1 methyl-accepting chemotaxis protein [Aliidiomarina quisquiliarum]
MAFLATIKSRMISSIILTVLLIMLALGFTLNGVRSISNSFEQYLQVNQVRMGALNTMYGEGLLAGVAARNKIFNPNLQMTAGVVAKANELFNDAFVTIRETGVGINNSTEINTIEKQWGTVVQARHRVLELSEQGKGEEAAKLLADIENPAWRDIRLAIDSMLQRERELAEVAKEKAQNVTTNTYAMGLIIGVLAILAAVFINFYITRSILVRIQTTREHLHDLAVDDADLTWRLDVSNHDEVTDMSVAINMFIERVQSIIIEVRDSTLQLAAAAEQVANITSQSEHAIQTQRDETEQVATAMNEMTATVQNVAQNALLASSAAREADEEARRGNRIVVDTKQAISNLAERVQVAVTSMDQVNDSSDRISGILEVIDGIAEQTNLLALNAAIEAARAGEQGRGFSVVADEVRNLAHRTQQATQQVSTMITELHTATQSVTGVMTQSRDQAQTTVALAEEAQQVLELITKAVTEINDMNTSIANAAEEQSVVADEINRNVTGISDASEQVSAGAEQTTIATAELAKLGEQLRQQVAYFKLE